MSNSDELDRVCEALHQYNTLGLDCVPLPDGKRCLDEGWQAHQYTEADFRRILARSKTPGIGIRLGPDGGLIDVEWDSASQRAKAYEIFGAALLDNCPAFGRPGDPNHEHRLLAWDERLAAFGKAVLYIACGGCADCLTGSKCESKLIIRIGAGGKGAYSAFPPSPRKEWR